MLLAELASGGWLHRLYGLPRAFVVFLGVVNLLYAAASGSAARAARPAAASLRAMAQANAAWAITCAVIAGLAATGLVGPRPSRFGFAHLLLEGALVAALARVEARAVEK